LHSAVIHMPLLLLQLYSAENAGNNFQHWRTNDQLLSCIEFNTLLLEGLSTKNSSAASNSHYLKTLINMSVVHYKLFKKSLLHVRRHQVN